MNQNIVKIEYPSRNTKLMKIKIGTLTLWFSYETIIAFDSWKTGFWISKNYWGTTTGRHLNEIHPDKNKRVTDTTFQEKLKLTLELHNLYEVK